MLVDNVTQCSVQRDETARAVAENLSASGLRLCLVIDSGQRLLGVVSDGDIRKALLAGLSLEDAATVVMNANFTSAPADTEHLKLAKLARSRGIVHVPLLDTDGRVTGLFIDQPESGLVAQDNTVVIMAGGLGMRLRPMTDSTPKPMLPVAGKPMVQHTIEALSVEGFQNFVLSINYLGEQIEDYFGDGSAFGVSISYVKEESPLGTAGALSLLTGPFYSDVVVVNGDVFLSVKISEMLAFHRANQAAVTVGVKLLETQIPYGVASLEGTTITKIQEKPVYRDFVNAGIYTLDPAVLDTIPAGKHLDMTDLVAQFVDLGSVRAFPLHERWMDLGRPEDLRRAEEAHGSISR